MGLRDVIKKVAAPAGAAIGAAAGGIMTGGAGALAGAKLGASIGGLAGKAVPGDPKNAPMVQPGRATSFEDAKGQDRTRMKKQYGL